MIMKYLKKEEKEKKRKLKSVKVEVSRLEMSASGSLNDLFFTTLQQLQCIETFEYFCKPVSIL